MNDAAFTAAHRAEEERLATLLDLVASGLGGEAEFFDAEQAIVIGVEHDQGMVFVRQAQHFHGEVFESEQQFCFVQQQHVGFGATEADDDIGVFDLGVSRGAFDKFVVDIDVNGIQKDV